MPRMTRQARHRTVIAQKERQIGKLRDEVERLRKILLERDTGTGENRETETRRKVMKTCDKND